MGARLGNKNAEMKGFDVVTTNAIAYHAHDQDNDKYQAQPQPILHGLFNYYHDCQKEHKV